MMAWTDLLCALASCLAACDAAGGMQGAPASAVSVALSVEAPGVRPELAQPDDLSVLYPLATSQAAFDRGYLTPASPGLGGPLLPAAVYEQAFGPPGTLQLGGTPAAPALAGLRMVAFRLDPCFARTEATPEAACEHQLRVVFQTLRFDGTQAIAADDAVHAFYRLRRDQLAAAVQASIALRRKHAGDRRQLGPLAPHPILVEQGLEGELAAAFDQLVLHLAGAQNLTRITQVTASGLGTAWNFSGVDVASGVTSRVKIPTVPAGTTTVAFFAGFSSGQLTGQPAFTPATEAAAIDDLQLLGDVHRAALASAADRQRAYDASLRIEDPAVHSPDTIDCASCHLAQAVRTMVGETAFHLTASIPELRVAAGRLPAPALDDRDVNVHMFGYKGKRAPIHQRTINEAAAVTAYVNATLLR
jgi:hypothetical protein